MRFVTADSQPRAEKFRSVGHQPSDSVHGFCCSADVGGKISPEGKPPIGRVCCFLFPDFVLRLGDPLIYALFRFEHPLLAVRHFEPHFLMSCSQDGRIVRELSVFLTPNWR